MAYFTGPKQHSLMRRFPPTEKGVFVSFEVLTVRVVYAWNGVYNWIRFYHLMFEDGCVLFGVGECKLYFKKHQLTINVRNHAVVQLSKHWISVSCLTRQLRCGFWGHRRPSKGHKRSKGRTYPMISAAVWQPQSTQRRPYRKPTSLSDDDLKWALDCGYSAAFCITFCSHLFHARVYKWILNQGISSRQCSIFFLYLYIHTHIHIYLYINIYLYIAKNERQCSYAEGFLRALICLHWMWFQPQQPLDSYRVRPCCWGYVNIPWATAPTR